MMIWLFGLLAAALLFVLIGAFTGWTQRKWWQVMMRTLRWIILGIVAILGLWLLIGWIVYSART